MNLKQEANQKYICEDKSLIECMRGRAIKIESRYPVT